MQKSYAKPASFQYVPPQELLSKVPRKYDQSQFQQRTYYYQYIAWQKQSDDPALRNSNYWADNWEYCGKFL